LKWPTDRVNAIYKAIIQREACESIEAQRVQMISALFANSNWDGDNSQARADHIKELNRHFNDAIELVYFPQGQADDIDWKNPFYAAARRGLQKTRLKYGLVKDETAEVIELTTKQDQEQIQARIEGRQAIDQM
jgi:intergrase/recombinase